VLRSKGKRILGVQNLNVVTHHTTSQLAKLGHAVLLFREQKSNRSLHANKFKTTMHELDDLAAPHKKRNPLVLVGKFLSLT